jgi:hypothetical protein
MKRDDYADIPPSDFEIRSMFEGDDELGVILKGHLYVEHFLSLVLSTVPALRADAAFRLSFAQKIDPAVEAGIIPAHEKGTFILINQIRNRFAHQPRSYFSEDNADAIWKALSPRMIDRFAIAGRSGPEYFDLPLDLFKCCIVVMCSILASELASRQ